MNQDEIIEMARQAGFNLEQGFLLRVTGIDEDLERFAKLVAAKEREACAKVCSDWMEPFSGFDAYSKGGVNGLTKAIKAIRARGEA